eukprot:3032335-Rhodomonas_salina.1
MAATHPAAVMRYGERAGGRRSVHEGGEVLLQGHQGQGGQSARSLCLCLCLCLAQWDVLASDFEVVAYNGERVGSSGLEWRVTGKLRLIMAAYYGYFGGEAEEALRCSQTCSDGLGYGPDGFFTSRWGQL